MTFRTCRAMGLALGLIFLMAHTLCAQAGPAERLLEAKQLLRASGGMESRTNSEKALAILQRLLNDSPAAPQAPFARYLAGVCLIRLDRFDEAGRAFEEALRRPADRDTTEGVLWHLGFVHLKTLNHLKAKQVYQRLRQEFPDSRRTAQIEKQLDRLKPVGTKAPVFKAHDLDGNVLDLKELSGKVVLLSFWATWCPPCRREMPNVKAAHDRYKADGLVAVGISLDEDRALLADYLKAHGMGWPHYCDGKKWQSPLARIYGVDSVPTAFLIDGKGIIRYAGLRGEDLHKACALLLKEP